MRRYKPNFSNFGLIVLPMLLAGTVSTIFFPGLMSYDSFYQYSQVIGAAPLDNSHPLIMVYLWIVLYSIWPSPGSLLVFHQLLYWIALAIFSWSMTTNKLYQLVILVVIGFWPPLIISSLHLWKDAGMLSAIILAVALLIADFKKPSWGWLLVSAIAIFYSCAVRYNAVLGLPFLCLLWATRFVIHLNLRSFRVISITAVACVSVGLTLASAKLVDGVKEGNGINSIIFFDLGALSIAKGKDMFPDYVLRKDNADFMSKLKSVFSREVNVPTYSLINGVPENRAGDLKEYWLKTSWRYLPDYLYHRSYVFSRMLWITGSAPFYPYHSGVDSNEYGISFAFLDGSLTWDWRSSFEKISHSFVYRPILYLLLSIVVFIYSFYRWLKIPNSFKWLACSSISASGLTMTLPLFFFAPAADFRYSLWMIATTILSSAIALILNEDTTNVSNTENGLS